MNKAIPRSIFKGEIFFSIRQVILLDIIQYFTYYRKTYFIFVMS